MMRRIWRVIFKGSQDETVDVEAIDIITACEASLAFLNKRGYNYGIDNINNVQVIAEPITFQTTKVTEGLPK